MKLNTSMPARLKDYYQLELKEYLQQLRNNNLTVAWRHLKRAHVIGQAYPLQHTYVHWKMLRFGIKIKNNKEILGQIPRLLAGGVKSFVGKIPVGNTGGADIPPLRSLPVEKDIVNMFKEAGRPGL